MLRAWKQTLPGTALSQSRGLAAAPGRLHPSCPKADVANFRLESQSSFGEVDQVGTDAGCRRRQTSFSATHPITRHQAENAHSRSLGGSRTQSHKRAIESLRSFSTT